MSLFILTPMSLATAMYHSRHNPLQKVKYKNKGVYTARTIEQRRLQKSILRYHNEEQWPQLRTALMEMGRQDLIGDGKNSLVPSEVTSKHRSTNRRKSSSNYRKSVNNSVGKKFNNRTSKR